MKRKLTLLTNFVQSVLVAMFFLFSIGEIRAQSSCAAMPAPVQYTHETKSLPFNSFSEQRYGRVQAEATIRGVTVTRILENKRRLSGTDKGVSYSGDEAPLNKWPVDEAPHCGNPKKTYPAGYPIMDSNRVQKITYRFSQPIADVEIFFAEFGYAAAAHKLDYATFTVNKGTLSLDIRKDCGNGAQLQGTDKIVSKSSKLTDVSIGLTSTEPFTELTIETDNYNQGHGFYVEICLESVLTPIDMSSCTPASVSANFPETTIANTTLPNGINVERTVEAGTSFGKLSAPHNTYCGTAVTYTKNLPLLNPSKKTLKYKFSSPITSAEIFLIAFGDNGSFTTYDEVQFAVDKGTIELSQTYNCNPSGTTITGGKVKSAANAKRTVDVAIKVTSSEPFTEITLTDQNSTGFGYFVALCPTSVFAQSATDNCTPATIGSNFPRQQVAETTMNGLTVKRTVANVGYITTAVNTSNHCGGNVNYPAGLPLLRDGKTLTYEFSNPIKSAEVFLYYFGDNINEGTLDKLYFAVNNGTASLTNVYDCRPGTTIINGTYVKSLTKRVTTDVGIKVTSTQPFNKITLTDDNSDGGGYYVVICPNSVQDAQVVSVTQQPVSQTTCETLPFSLTSKAVLKTGFTGAINYKWEQSTDNGVTWGDPSVQGTFTGTINSGGTTSLTINFVSKPSKKYRVIYSYEVKPGIIATATSTIADIDVRDKIEVTEFKASPATIQLGVPTNVQFTIKGTVGADVTYNINGTNTQTVNLGASGIYTFNRTLSQTTDITITKIKKICEVTVPMRLSVGGDGAACTGMPPSLFAASDNATVVLSGITVTRSFANGVVKVLGSSQYSRDPQCPAYWFANNAWVGDTPGTPKLTYKFSKPITSAQIWLSAFSVSSTTDVDKAKFTVNCGATSQISVTDDCRNNTSFTVQSQNTVVAAGMGNYDNTNIAVVVTADKPFTEITVDALNSRGNGYLVELCPSSIKEATLSITTQPQSQSVCEMIGTATFTSHIDTAGFTGMVSYQWQNSNDKVTWNNDLSGGTTDGTATLTLSNIYSGNFKPFYRVIYTYNLCSTSLTATSTVATLTLTNAGLETVKAYPNSIKTGIATNVNFVFKGTAGAKISYTIAGVAQPILTLPAGGVATITKSISAATNLVVTKIEGNCTVSSTNIVVKIAEEGATCDAVPALQFATVDNAKTILNGVEVTRNFAGGTPKFTPVTAAIGTCQPFYLGGYAWVGGTEGATKTTFAFSKPITKAEVWLAVLNGAVAPQQPDKAKFTINCGTISLSVTDCRNGGVSIQSGHTIITTVTNTSDDARVIVTSDKPFTELTVDGLDSGGAGYAVELCPTSIVPATLSITTQPQSQSVCQGAAVTLTATATLSNTTYQWQKRNGSTWANVGAVQNTTNGIATLTLSTNTQTTAYRVIFSVSGCGGGLTATSTVATITVSTLAVTQVRAIPATIEKGVATTVAFVVKATPTAKVAYRYNGGAVQTVTMNAAGVYTHTVTVSNTATLTVVRAVLGNCSTITTLSATVQAIVVPIIGADHYTVPMTPTSTTTRTIGRITNNDRIGTASVTLSTGGNATLTVTPVPANTPFIDPATGDVKVPPTTPAGVYTISYQLCTTAAPVGCRNGQLTVTITQPRPQINPDGFVVTGTGIRTTPSVFNNDRVVNADGSTTTGTGSTLTITNVTVQPIVAGHPTPTINADGTITVPNNAVPGVYTITYDVCTTATPSTCVSSTATLTVKQPAPVIRPDSFTVTGTGTRTTPSILDNDDVVNPDGSTTSATGSNVTITNVVVTPTRPGYPVPTVNPNGTITIPDNAAPGLYTITYDVCTVATPTECTSGTVTFTVVPQQPTLVVTPDPLVVTGTGTRTTPSVLDNDHFINPDGSTTSATSGNVTITNVVVTPSTPGTLSPTLNPDGTITVPNGLRPGVYTITYDMCVASSTCVSATTTLTVRQPAPIINPDSFTVTGTGTRTTPSIFDNDTFVNPDGSTTSATGSNVTITNVVVTPTRPGYPVPTVNPNGTITIPGNAAPGNYTITYNVCTVATPTECTEGVVTFTVVSDTSALPIAENDSAQTFIGTPVTIEVLTNDTPNGAVTPVITVTPAKGTAVVNADGTIEYTPNRNFVGIDSFVYELCNAAGCATATVSVKVGSEIIIYNGVSLNGSDANNHFHIGGIENYPNNKVRIYNRWGVEVFSVEGYDNVTKVFTGRSSARTTVEAGDRLPQGTYYYVIEYQDLSDKKQTASGWLYLKK